MLSGTIIVKKAGFVIPGKLISLALSNNTSCCGFSMIGKQKEGDKNDELIAQCLPQSADLSKISLIQNKFKDKTLAMYFGSSNIALQNAALQPHILAINPTTKKPAIVAFLDGDFSKFADSTSAYPDSYHAVDKDLKPRVKEWLEDCNFDMKKFVERLQKSSTKKTDIENLWSGKGAVLLYTDTDTTLLFQKGMENYKEFDWGACTNTYGYDGKSAEKVEEPKEGKVINFLAADEDDEFADPVPEKAKPDGDGDGGDNKPVETKPTEAPQPDVKAPEKVDNPPSSLTSMFLEVPKAWKNMSKTDRRKWFTSRSIKTPSDWNSPKYEGHRLFCQPHEMAIYLEKGYVVQGGQQQTAATKSADPVGPVKDTTTKHVGKQTSVQTSGTPLSKMAEDDDSFADPVINTEKANDTGFRPFEGTSAIGLLPPTQREAIGDWLLSKGEATYTDASGKVIPHDPRSIQELESALPLFSKQIGIDLESTFKWDFDTHLELGKEYGITALTLLALEYRKNYLALLASGNEGKSGKEDVKPTQQKKQVSREGWAA